MPARRERTGGALGVAGSSQQCQVWDPWAPGHLGRGPSPGSSAGLGVKPEKCQPGPYVTVTNNPQASWFKTTLSSHFPWSGIGIWLAKMPLALGVTWWGPGWQPSQPPCGSRLAQWLLAGLSSSWARVPQVLEAWCLEAALSSQPREPLPRAAQDMVAGSIRRNNREKPEGDIPPFLRFSTVRGSHQVQPPSRRGWSAAARIPGGGDPWGPS